MGFKRPGIHPNGWEEMAKGRLICYAPNDSGRVTVYLRTVLTFSHTSWSHYSKVFFVKGKGGKRGVANLFWATAERREQRMTERRATKKTSTTEERATQDKASTRRRERHAAERTERGRRRHASTFFWRFSISWFFIFFSILMLPLAFRNSTKTENSLKWRILKFSIWASREIWKPGISKLWKREMCKKSKICKTR